MENYGLIENPARGRWSSTSKFSLDEFINLDEDSRKKKAKEMHTQDTKDRKEKKRNTPKKLDLTSSNLGAEFDDLEEIDDIDLEGLGDDSYIESDELDTTPQPIIDSIATYTAKLFLEDTSITPEELDRYEKTIKRKKQIILAGSTGTGKTFIAQKFAKYLTSDRNGYVDLVQFHPSYTYEDFMRGLKPEIKDGK
ncbi:AAA family ATPase [Pseudanabaena sp. UWO310]|uniref:AAA family ATPase n=1 Tax=Pseudanabaena sp. UWO310 TaxID=2480795 RepID=UPI00116149FA|nr:AAA family ATPase [Pseudanabaena sp. UWO310]TYQ23742.1 AAA domain-containing protein [Pseudanabaena sp. UWO310]